MYDRISHTTQHTQASQYPFTRRRWKAKKERHKTYLPSLPLPVDQVPRRGSRPRLRRSGAVAVKVREALNAREMISGILRWNRGNRRNHLYGLEFAWSGVSSRVEVDWTLLVDIRPNALRSDVMDADFFSLRRPSSAGMVICG